MWDQVIRMTGTILVCTYKFKFDGEERNGLSINIKGNISGEQ